MAGVDEIPHLIRAGLAVGCQDAWIADAAEAGRLRGMKMVGE